MCINVHKSIKSRALKMVTLRLCHSDLGWPMTIRSYLRAGGVYIRQKQADIWIYVSISRLEKSA
jgi:hypothetical protein